MLRTLRNLLSIPVLLIVALFTGTWRAFIQPALVLSAPQAGEITDKIIGLVVAVLIVSAVIGVALNSIAGTNTASWSTGAVAIWGVLGTLIVAGVVLMVWKAVKGE